jgi:hypothetical protein
MKATLQEMMALMIWAAKRLTPEQKAQVRAALDASQERWLSSLSPKERARVEAEIRAEVIRMRRTPWNDSDVRSPYVC